MLSENDIKEQLSYAYVHAISARSGFSCDRPSVDRDSIDATISAKGQLATTSVVTSPKLDLQLKATAFDHTNGDTFAFDLPVKNYNDLVKPRMVPALLVVFAMPTNSEEWLFSDETGLITRRCAYWMNLRGEEETTNQTTKRVYVPTQNLLTCTALRELLTRASKMEEIGYEL